MSKRAPVLVFVVLGACGGGGGGDRLDAAGADASAHPDGAPAADPVVQISGQCAVTTKHALYCWGGVVQSAEAKLIDVDADGNPLQLAQIAWGTDAFGVPNLCGRTPENAIACYGWNDFGQLARSPAFEYRSAMSAVGGVRLSTVALSSSHVCGLDPQGHPICWGLNDGSQLGHSPGALGDVTAPCASGLTCNPTPAPIDAAAVFTQIAAGDGFTCASGPQAGVACWGANDASQPRNILGSGAPAHRKDPGRILTYGGAALGGVQSVSAGIDDACVVTNSQGAWCWGSNRSGQLGVGDGLAYTDVGAVQFGAWNDVTAISAGVTTCAVRGGHVFCAGDDGFGQLGDGGGGAQSSPVAVRGADGNGVLSDIVQVATTDAPFVVNPADHPGMSGFVSCALDGAGRVYCWGRADQAGHSPGTLGDVSCGAERCAPYPVRVQGLP